MIINIYDTETNGLLEGRYEKGQWVPPMDKIHTLTMIVLDTEQGTERKISCCDQPGYEMGTEGRGWERMPLLDGLRILAEADLRVAHNGLTFDEDAIPLVYPWWKPKEGSSLIDTIVWSRFIYPDIHRAGPNGWKVPGHMKKNHSLAAWGYRLGEHKGEYKGGWLQWNEDMQSYGEQDTVVLAKLFKWLRAQEPAPVASELEHEFASIIRRQERRGFGFDHEKALVLLASLQQEETTLETSLIESFGEWWDYGKPANTKAAYEEGPSASDEDDEDMDDPEEQAKRKARWEVQEDFAKVVTPTKTRRAKIEGYAEIEVTPLSPTTGLPLKPRLTKPSIQYSSMVPFTPMKRTEFNPSSRTHVQKRLKVKYGWVPEKFSKGGKSKGPQPVIDDDVLSALPYPEAKGLAKYFLLQKRIGQLATGRKAWLKMVRETHLPTGQTIYRIHGRVNTNGAVTGRCTHSNPNVAQVPKNTAGVKDYPDSPILHGSTCRDLFIPIAPYELWGFDGSSLELCMLAHYVSKYDKGEYATIVSEGKKELGTDPHSWLRDLIGVDIIGKGEAGRDNAKTVMYADLYGAGDEKRGAIVIPRGTKKEKIELGKEIGFKMAENFSAKADLQSAIEASIEANGFLKGLDGRTLRIRKAHAALNTLLQSAGAIVMKKALVILDKQLSESGLQCGPDYEFVANIHDEVQSEVLPKHSEVYDRLATMAVPQAGIALRVKCPLKAEAGKGLSWKYTH